MSEPLSRGLWKPAPSSNAFVGRLNFPTIDEVGEKALSKSCKQSTMRLFLKFKEIDTDDKARTAAAMIEEVLAALPEKTTLAERTTFALPRLIEMGSKDNFRGAIVETAIKDAEELKTKLGNLDMVAFVRIMTSQ